MCIVKKASHSLLRYNTLKILRASTRSAVVAKRELYLPETAVGTHRRLSGLYTLTFSDACLRPGDLKMLMFAREGGMVLRLVCVACRGEGEGEEEDKGAAALVGCGRVSLVAKGSGVCGGRPERDWLRSSALCAKTPVALL